MWDETQMVGRTKEEKKEDTKVAVEELKAKVEEIIAEAEAENTVVECETVEEVVEVIKADMEKENSDAVVISVPCEDEEVAKEILETMEEALAKEEDASEPVEETVVESDEKTEEVSKVEEEPVVASEAVAEPVVEKKEMEDCPFCGKAVTLTYFKKWFVTGHDTTCILSPNFAVGKTKEQMQEAWNKRV